MIFWSYSSNLNEGKLGRKVPNISLGEEDILQQFLKPEDTLKGDYKTIAAKNSLMWMKFPHFTPWSLNEACEVKEGSTKLFLQWKTGHSHVLIGYLILSKQILFQPLTFFSPLVEFLMQIIFHQIEWGLLCSRDFFSVTGTQPKFFWEWSLCLGF